MAGRNERSRVRPDSGREAKAGTTRPAVLSVMAILLGGIAVAVLGTVLHRAGADRNIPWGLILSLLLAFLYAALCRRDLGTMGLALGLLVSTVLVWIFAIHTGPGGDVLIPIASPAFTTSWSRSVGYCWIYGATLSQLLAFAIPRSALARS